MEEMMESIKEYLRSCHGVVRAPLAYIIRKTIIVQIYDDYTAYTNPDKEMIARMLHQPPDKNKMHNEQSAQSVMEHMAEWKTDNRTVYNILDQICKDTDLYPYFKQHKSKGYGGGAFHPIHSRWLGPNHVNTTASEAKMELRKYVAWHVKYHNILGNLIEYGYQDLDSRSKVHYLLNGIRCDKLSTAVAAVRTHPDKYEKDFDAIVTFVTQYIDKRAPTQSVNVATISQSRPAKKQKTSTTHGTFKGKI